MENIKTQDEIIDLIVEKRKGRKLYQWVYLIANGPLAMILLGYSLYNIVAIIPYFLELNSDGIVYFVTQCFQAAWMSGILIGCVGVYFSKQWGRIIVIVMCSVAIFNVFVSVGYQLIMSAVTYRVSITFPIIIGCAVWLYLFAKRKYDFMNEDNLRKYLIVCYEKKAADLDKKCLNCEFWDGGRKSSDEKYDARCEYEDAYHKGDYVCSAYYPVL